MQPEQTEYTLGDRTFRLDTDKARQSLADKRVINGRNTPFFNLAPLKYHWAYDLYVKMQANQWVPTDIEMQRDIQQWHSQEHITDSERHLIEMAIGYFSGAEGIVGNNILSEVRDVITASELKLVLNRHAHEENIHADSLLYMISSIGVNPHRCEALFQGVATIQAKADFVMKATADLAHFRGDMTSLEAKQALAQNLFVYGQCMEGTQFYGLFGMVLALARQQKFPGIGEMFRYTMRDESNHIEVFRNLLMDLVDENPELWTEDFQNRLQLLMDEAVELEVAFIEDCLPSNIMGLTQADFVKYVRYIANRRLSSVGLTPVYGVTDSPLPWLSEIQDLAKRENFFETKVTEYSSSSVLKTGSSDDL